MGARIFGSGERIAVYEVDDTELAAGSTLGGAKGAIVIKASGAIDKFYSSDIGATLLVGIRVATTRFPASFPNGCTARRLPIKA